MTAFLTSLTVWHWLVFGAGLMTVEIFIPGAFFLWPGLAAVLVGLMTAVIPMPWTASVSLWALLSLATVAGWVFYRKKNPSRKTADSGLNRRGQEFVGRVFTLEKPLINGKGEIHAGDTMWKIVSDQDLASGALVRVTAVEGTFLRVAPNS